MFNGNFLSGASVDGLVAVVVFHQVEGQFGKVVDIEKFTEGAAVAPAHHFAQAGHFGFVESSDEGRQHVAVFRVVVVVGAV